MTWHRHRWEWRVIDPLDNRDPRLVAICTTQPHHYAYRTLPWETAMHAFLAGQFWHLIRVSAGQVTDMLDGECDKAGHT